MLKDLARSFPLYADLLEKVRRGDPLLVAGGVGALPAALLAALREDLERPLALVVANEKEAERWIGDLAAAGLARVLHAPGADADAVPAHPALAEGDAATSSRC